MKNTVRGYLGSRPELPCCRYCFCYFFLIVGQIVVRDKWSHRHQVFGLSGIFFDAGARALSVYCVV